MFSNLILILATVANFAHANPSSGVIHDGGGQLVRINGGHVDIADVYPPKGDREAFEPAGLEPIDLYKTFPSVQAEVHTLSVLYAAYTSQDRRPELETLIYNPYDSKAYRYYLVDKLPDVSDCRQPRDNSGVPSVAEVSHVACTRGNVTLLLNSGDNAFARLPARVQAAVLGHEGFRHVTPLIETGTIEAVIGGLTTAREILEQQRHGSRAPLTAAQVAILNDMLLELHRAEMRKGTEEDSVFKNGGGLVYAQKMGAGLFVGIGSEVSGFQSIGDNVTVLESKVSGYVYQGATLESNITIERSTLHAPYRENVQLHVGSGVQITDSVLWGSLVIAKDSTLQSVHAGDDSAEISIGAGVKIVNSELLNRNYSYHKSYISIANAVTITDSHLAKVSEDLPENRDAVNLEIGDNASVTKSNIDFSRSYQQGADAKVEGLNFRVRPLYWNSRWSVNTDVQVAEGSVVKSDGTPIVLFAQSGFFSSTSTVRMAGQLNLVNTATTCAMGADAKTRTESGIVIQDLDLNNLEQLMNCKISAPLSERECSHLGGCSGTDLKEVPKRNGGHC